MLPLDFAASVQLPTPASASKLSKPSYTPLSPTGYAYVELSAAPASPPSLSYSKYRWMAHAARQGALAPLAGSARSSHAAFSPLPSPDSHRAASPLRVGTPPPLSPLAAPPTAAAAGALPAAALPAPAPSPAAGAQQPRPAASASAAQPLTLASPLTAPLERDLRDLPPWWLYPLAALALCLLAPMSAPALLAFFATRALLREQ